MSDDRDLADLEALSTIAGGATWVMGGRVAKLIMLFFIQVFMARMLNPSSYGGVIIATAVMSVASLIGALGLPGCMTRKVAYYEDDPAKARGTFWTGLALGAASGMLISAGIVIAAPFLSTHVFDSPELVPILRIAAIAIPFSILSGTGISIAKASRDAKTHVVIKQLVRPASKVLFVTLFIFVLGLGAVGAMAGIAFSIVLGGVGALLLAYRAFRVPVWGETDLMFLEVLAFSLPLMFAAGAHFLIGNSDTFLIGTFLSTTAVSNYDVAFKLQQLGTLFFFPATFLLPSVLTRLQKKDKMIEVRAVYQVVTKWTTLFSLPLFLTIFLFPDIVIMFTFGRKYLAGAEALRILSVPILVTVALGANGASLISLGHNRINLYVNSGVALLNIGLNVVFIPSLGIVGAALASAVTFIARDGLFTLSLYRWYEIHPFSRAMVKPVIAACITAPFVATILKMATPSDLLTLVLFGVFIVVVYFPVMIRLGAIEPIDVRVFNYLESSVGVNLEVVRRVIQRLRA